MSGLFFVIVPFLFFVIMMVVVVLRLRKALNAQLKAMGFRPCNQEAGKLKKAFRELASGCGDQAGHDFKVYECFKKRISEQYVYRFVVIDEAAKRDASLREYATSYHVFLLNWEEPNSSSFKPVSVFIAPGSRLSHHPVIPEEKSPYLDQFGLPLTLDCEGDHIIAAVAPTQGRLSEHLSPGTIGLLAGAGEVGIWGVHFGKKRAAFLSLVGKAKDLQAQWAFLKDWVS